VALTHPPGWGGHRTAALRQALADAGLGHAALLSEPEAAALHYAAQERLEPGSTVAVYDLGGTFDAAILRKSGAACFEMLGRPESIGRLGGAEVDDAVFAHVRDGLGEALAGLDTADAPVLLALSKLRRECTEAKEALAYDTEVSIPVLLPGVQAHVRLKRPELEGMIGGLLRETIEALRRALQSAGVAPDDLAAIVLAGGSSRTPLAARLLSEEFGRPVAVGADPKAATALGAALAAAERFRAAETGAAPQRRNAVAAQLTFLASTAAPEPHSLGPLAAMEPSAVELSAVESGRGLQAPADPDPADPPELLTEADSSSPVR
jgi:molecular chaperone DnaK